MSKKKRLPHGGKKVNYTLYMSPDDKKKISDRADELGMADSFYVVTLAGIDSQLGLAEHLLAGGLIDIVPLGTDPTAHPVVDQQEEVPIQPGEMPVPPAVSAVEKELIQEEFKDNIGQSKKQAVPDIKGQQPVRPMPQRPVMKSVQDLVADSKHSVAGTVPGQQLTVNMDKVHRATQQDQRGEAAMRKSILENLPPKQEEK